MSRRLAVVLAHRSASKRLQRRPSAFRASFTAHGSNAEGEPARAPPVNVENLHQRPLRSACCPASVIRTHVRSKLRFLPTRRTAFAVANPSLINASKSGALYRARRARLRAALKTGGGEQFERAAAAGLAVTAVTAGGGHADQFAPGKRNFATASLRPACEPARLPAREAAVGAGRRSLHPSRRSAEVLPRGGFRPVAADEVDSRILVHFLVSAVISANPHITANLVQISRWRGSCARSAARMLSFANHSNTLAMSMGKKPVSIAVPTANNS